MPYHTIDMVPRPSDGKEFEVIRCGSAVAGVLYDNVTDELIVVRQWRAGANSFVDEIVAGMVDGSELHSAAFIREAQEEVGLRPQTVVELGSYWSSPGRMDESVTLFFGTDLVVSELPQDESEQIKVVRYPANTMHPWVDIKSALAIIDCRARGFLTVAVAPEG